MAFSCLSAATLPSMVPRIAALTSRVEHVSIPVPAERQVHHWPVRVAPVGTCGRKEQGATCGMARPQCALPPVPSTGSAEAGRGGVGQGAACSGAERRLRASLLPTWVGHVAWVGHVTWVRAAAVHDADVVDGHGAEGAAGVRVRGRPGQVGLDVRRQLELRRAVTRGERAERDEDRDRVRRQVLPGR